MRSEHVWITLGKNGQLIVVSQPSLISFLSLLGRGVFRILSNIERFMKTVYGLLTSDHFCFIESSLC